MKVLEVLDCFYPNIDGPINVCVNIAQIANTKNLAEVEMLVPSYPKNYDCDNVVVHRCRSLKSTEGYRMAIPKFDRKVKKLIKNGGFDVVHVHSPFGLGRYAVKMAKKYKIPVCFTVHTKFKSDFERKLKSKFLQNFMLKYILKPMDKSDYVLSVSNGAGETVKEYGCKKEKIHIIRNGTDMKPAMVEQSLKDDVIKKYNLAGKFVFLFVGRIVPNKNVQFSLEVLKLLKQKTDKDFVFLVVGGGDYIPKLEKLAEDYGISENVVFVGKVMDREYLSAIYACADLFLFPSTFDTCGIVALEAAVNGLPSVMIENSCASELIVTGKNGLGLPEEASVWADNIKKVMDNPKLLQDMKTDVKKTLYIPWEQIVNEYIEFYQKMIKNEVN